MKDKIVKSPEEWRAILPPEVYRVAREQGTERAFASPLNDEKRDGMFTCACCGEPLFESDAKFNSGTGWPSFYKPENDAALEEYVDRSHGMTRTEVQCARCGAHLGHVFPDGPRPTGLRYCMNGAALDFKPEKEQQ